MTSWEQAVADYQAQRSADSSQSWARRRAFLVQVGIDRGAWKTHRLRKQDGLSEEIWLLAVKQAMHYKKVCGTRRLGKKIGQ